MARWFLLFSAALLPLLGACDPPAVDADADGFVSDLDCNDEDASINPGVDEACDGLDNNCDGTIDEGVTITFYTDSDGDGAGNSDAPVEACALVDGIAEVGEDCDDLDDEVYPDAIEVCDYKDNDCNGEIDEEVKTTFFADVDGDGFGDAQAPVEDCELFDGIVEDDTDCDDTAADVNPAADEVCDGIDNNCADGIDEDTAIDAPTWFRDSDGDSFGNAIDAVNSCEQPIGYVADDTDCNDSAENAYPGADELCDTIDNDCDTQIDEDTALDATLWYTDADGDGFGVEPTVVQCYTPGSGWTDTTGDCDDSKSDVYPGAIEYCNGYDDDCDTITDETDAVDARTWYRDFDGDAFGDAGRSTRACTAPGGYIADDTDCDDTDSATYPGADEYCDGHDDDCDGTVDEDDAVDADTWYEDSDSDGYGDADITTRACSLPTGYVADDTDCDDTDGNTYPGADEYCDGHDDDCDRVVDEDDAVDATTWYADADSDTYGDSSDSTKACSAPAGYVADDTDCDDSDSTLNPATKWYYDGDGDGYGSDTSFRTQCADPGTAYVRTGGDCRTSDAKSYPGATEICVSGIRAEGIDNDCDGSIDETCPDVHCGTITSDETWKPNTYGHLVTCNVYVQGSLSPTLTIDAGTEVDFNSNTGLFVGQSNDGDVVMSGTSGKPITLTSSASSPRKGNWYGVHLGFKADGSSIAYTTVRYAGGSTSWPAAIDIDRNDTPLEGVTVKDSDRHGIYIRNAEPEITDSTIENNDEYGVYCTSSTCLDDADGSFDGNTVTRNGNAMRLYARSVQALSDSTGSTYTGNTTPEIVVYGDTISEDATWHDLGVSYRIDTSVYVQSSTGSPKLTLDDGVELVFDSSTGLFVGNSYSGDIAVDGTGGDGVTMKTSSGSWYGLVLGRGTSSSTEIAGLDISKAGASTSWPANITITGGGRAKISDSTVWDSDRHGIYVAASSRMSLTGTEVHDNDNFGLLVDDRGILDGAIKSSDFTSNEWPMRLPYIFAHLLDTSSSYDGNTNDFIDLRHHTSLATSQTWKDLDVPYFLSESLYVQSSGGATLTLDPGVHLTVGDKLWIFIGSSQNGDLIIKGDRSTSGKEVIIEAKSGRGAGRWGGLVLGSYTSAITDLAGFTLRDAGYSSSYPGGIYMIYGTAAMSDCVIEDNERWGIYMYTAGSSHSDLDLDGCTIQGTTTTNSSSLPDGDGLYMRNDDGHQLALNDVTLTKNDRYPMTLHANQMVKVHAEADGSSYSGNTRDQIYVHGGIVTSSGTWADPGVPYLVGRHIYLQNSSTAPTTITTSGTEFQMGLGQAIMVGSGNYGDLDATSATFTSSRGTPLSGDWCGVHFGQYSSGASKIDKSTLEYGGKSSGCPYYYYGYATIMAFRSAVSVTNSTISDSADQGIYLREGTAKVTGNTINDSKLWGVYCWRTTGGGVSGNSYSGNGSGTKSGCR